MARGIIQDDPEAISGLRFYFNFKDFEYLPQSRSLFFIVKFEQREVYVKVENLFLSNPGKNFLKKIGKKLMDQSTMVRAFGDNKLLTYHTGEVRSTYLRPLAWVDVETLEQTKIEGLEKEGRSHLLFKMNYLDKNFYTKLSENRLLIANDFSAFIYDLELDQAIAEQRLGIAEQRLGMAEQRMGSAEWVHFFLLRTQKNKEGEEVIDKVKIIHFNDLIPNLNIARKKCFFNFFKLKNGDYLYVSEHLVEDSMRAYQKIPRLFSVEIDQATLNVNKLSLPLPNVFGESVNAAHIQHVNGFLLMKAHVGMPHHTEVESENSEDSDEEYLSLVLASTDLTLIDHCTHAKLLDDYEFSAFYSNRVVSVGVENRVYLHEIDVEKRKLVFLKSIRLDNGGIMRNGTRLMNSPHFYLLMWSKRGNPKGEEEEKEDDWKGIVLKFDMNLDLESYLKLIEDPTISSISPLGGSKVAFSGYNRRLSTGSFVMDLETRVIQLAHIYGSTYGYANYALETEGGREKVICVESFGEKIIKVVLN